MKDSRLEVIGLYFGVLSKSSEATVTLTSGGGVANAEKDVEELGKVLNNI